MTTRRGMLFGAVAAALTPAAVAMLKVPEAYASGVICEDALGYTPNPEWGPPGAIVYTFDGLNWGPHHVPYRNDTSVAWREYNAGRESSAGAASLQD